MCVFDLVVCTFSNVGNCMTVSFFFFSFFPPLWGVWWGWGGWTMVKGRHEKKEKRKEEEQIKSEER